jgi:hypothetical protein
VVPDGEGHITTVEKSEDGRWILVGPRLQSALKQAQNHNLTVPVPCIDCRPLDDFSDHTKLQLGDTTPSSRSSTADDRKITTTRNLDVSSISSTETISDLDLGHTKIFLANRRRRRQKDYTIPSMRYGRYPLSKATIVNSHTAFSSSSSSSGNTRLSRPIPEQRLSSSPFDIPRSYSRSTKLQQCETPDLRTPRLSDSLAHENPSSTGMNTVSPISEQIRRDLNRLKDKLQQRTSQHPMLNHKGCSQVVQLEPLDLIPQTVTSRGTSPAFVQNDEQIKNSIMALDEHLVVQGKRLQLIEEVLRKLGAPASQPQPVDSLSQGKSWFESYLDSFKQDSAHTLGTYHPPQFQSSTDEDGSIQRQVPIHIPKDIKPRMYSHFDSPSSNSSQHVLNKSVPPRNNTGSTSSYQPPQRLYTVDELQAVIDRAALEIGIKLEAKEQSEVQHEWSHTGKNNDFGISAWKKHDLPSKYESANQQERYLSPSFANEDANNRLTPSHRWRIVQPVVQELPSGKLVRPQRFQAWVNNSKYWM